MVKAASHISYFSVSFSLVLGSNALVGAPFVMLVLWLVRGLLPVNRG